MTINNKEKKKGYILKTTRKYNKRKNVIPKISDKNEDKVIANNYLDKIINNILILYPFLDINKLHSIKDSVCNLSSHSMFISDFFNNISMEYCFMKQHEGYLIHEYSTNIFANDKKKLASDLENEHIRIVNSVQIYYPHIYEGDVYFVDNFNNLFDDENILVGFLLKGKPILMKNLLQFLED